ncbi:MAG: MATE family efflux transporter [Phycisphaerales bacterium]|nr:MATE family efflux transporter [Phycisphaerales bacterium]
MHPPAPAADRPTPHPRPLLELLQIAGPSVATMASYTVMQFVDKLMVSKIGPDPIYVGAQGNGGLAAFVPISIAMGMVTVVNTYVSQNLGAGRARSAPAYAWAGLWLMAIYWVAVMLPFALLLPHIFAWLGHTGEGARLSTRYGQILVVGSILTMSTRAIAQYFYGMHRAWVVMVAGIIANLVNLALAYGLVLGHFGMPALGVAGSGYATVIATGVELAIPMAIFLGARLHREFNTRGQWRLSRERLRDLLRLGWPAGLMFGNEMICWGYFMVGLVGGFGDHHATAGWIAHQYMSLSFMPAVGISFACTALVGRYMGMDRPDLAARRAWLGLSVCLAYMGLCGVLFYVLRVPMVELFLDRGTPPDVAAEIIRLGSTFLIAAACFQAFDAVAMTMSGSLRGAGDTVMPGVVTVILSWGIIVLGGRAVIAWWPDLGSTGPWIAASSYIAVLSLYLLGRFVSGRWRSIRLVGAEAAPQAGAAMATDGMV